MLKAVLLFEAYMIGYKLSTYSILLVLETELKSSGYASWIVVLLYPLLQTVRLIKDSPSWEYSFHLLIKNTNSHKMF